MEYRIQIQPKLYILVRSDIYQMNPGKAIAQACHAQSLFNHSMQEVCPYDESVKKAYKSWLGAYSFGTTITLEATLEEIYSLNDDIFNIDFGIVVDPSYPYSNYYGKRFTKSETTCAYVFVHAGTKEQVLNKLAALKLYE